MSVDRPDPISFLFAALDGPGGIDDVSRRGHDQMRPDSNRVASLPARAFSLGRREPERAPAGSVFTERGEVDHQAVLEKAGVVFGDVQPHNKLFRDVVLPEGWKIERTGHYMYSNLLDERGRKRAQIMYTAQDREAWYVTNLRFMADAIRDDYGSASSHRDPYVPVVEDSDGKQLWRGPETKASSDPLVDSGMDARKIAVEKLTELAPRWRDPTAYWGDDGDAIVWPPHETPPDTRLTYVLVVHCYRDGMRCDSGENSVCKAHDDDEAKKKLVDRCTLLNYYDEVRWDIKCGDRLVCSGVIKRPPARSRPDERWMDPYGWRDRR